MSNRIKAMIAGMFLVPSIVNNSMSDREMGSRFEDEQLPSIVNNSRSVIEKARMFEDMQREKEFGNQSEQRKVGKLKKDFGYVFGDRVEEADFAQRQGLEHMKKAVNNVLQSINDIDKTRDVVLFVKNKLNGNKVGEPRYELKSNVRYLINQLEGFPEREQIYFLDVILTELAINGAV